MCSYGMFMRRASISLLFFVLRWPDKNQHKFPSTVRGLWKIFPLMLLHQQNLVYCFVSLNVSVWSIFNQHKFNVELFSAFFLLTSLRRKTDSISIICRASCKESKISDVWKYKLPMFTNYSVTTRETFHEIPVTMSWILEAGQTAWHIRNFTPVTNNSEEKLSFQWHTMTKTSSKNLIITNPQAFLCNKSFMRCFVTIASSCDLGLSVGFWLKLQVSNSDERL